MRLLLIILLLSCSMESCGQNPAQTPNPSDQYYANNEDKFGFLVFDKEKTDSFFARYSSMEYRSPQLDSSFRWLLKRAKSGKTIDSGFGKHTRSPDQSDYDLAELVFDAVAGSDGQNFYGDCLQYLFFFECLPDRFQPKWVQTTMGDFEFNVTFFNRLLTRCKVFGDFVSGNKGYQDSKFKPIFPDETYNELTADKASLIKDFINQDTGFNDNRLQPDKDYFIYFWGFFYEGYI